MKNSVSLILIFLCFANCVSSETNFSINSSVFDKYPEIPEEWSNFMIFYEKYRVIFVSIFIVFGIIECFLGYKSLKSTFFVVGFITGFIPFFIVSTVLLKNSIDPNVLNYVCLGIGLFMGIFLGILMVLLFKFGKFMLGALCGIIFSFYIYAIPIALIEVQSDWTFYYLIMFFGLEFGVFPLFYEKESLCCFTAFVGSLIISISISQFIGYWPNPLNTSFYDQIKNRDVYWEWYLYFGIFLFFFIIGGLFQILTSKETVIKDKNVPILKKTNKNNQSLYTQNYSRYSDMKESSYGLTSNIYNERNECIAKRDKRYSEGVYS